MTVENIKPRLIDPADVGGLPVFNDDILQAQNNNRNTSKEYFEFLRSGINNNTGQLSWQDSPTTTTNRDMGLIISGCVLDTTVPAPYPISEGYVYIDGEVLKFPGTTVNAGEYVEMKKGAVTNTQRTFKDGSPKNATEEYALEWRVGATSVYYAPTYTGSQIVFILGGYTEWQTIIGAQNLLTQRPDVGGTTSTGILAQYDNPIFNNGTLESYTTGTVRSRIKEQFTNEVSISATVDTATFDDGVEDYLIATLSDWNPTDNIIGVSYVRGTNATDDLTVNIRVLSNGQVWIRKPLGNATWPTSGGGSTYDINFIGESYGTPTVITEYKGYNQRFMTKS